MCIGMWVGVCVVFLVGCGVGMLLFVGNWWVLLFVDLQMLCGGVVCDWGVDVQLVYLMLYDVYVVKWYCGLIEVNYCVFVNEFLVYYVVFDVVVCVGWIVYFNGLCVQVISWWVVVDLMLCGG